MTRCPCARARAGRRPLLVLDSRRRPLFVLFGGAAAALARRRFGSFCVRGVDAGCVRAAREAGRFCGAERRGSSRLFRALAEGISEYVHCF